MLVEGISVIIRYLIFYGGMVLAELTIVRLYSSLLRPKYKVYKIVGCMVLVNCVHNWMKTENILIPELVYITFMAYGIFFVAVFFKGRIIDKILLFIESSIAQIFSEIVCVGIFFGLLDYNWEEAACGISTTRVIICVMAQFIFMIVTELILLFQRPVRKYILDKSVLPIAMAFFIQMIIGLVYSYIYTTVLELKTSAVFWLYAGLIVFVDLIIVQSMLELLLIKQTTTNLNYIKEKEQVVQEYYTNLCRDINNLSAYKREYERKLREIYKLIGRDMDEESESGDAAKAVKGNKAGDEVNPETNYEANVNRVILNDILNSRKLELQELGLSYDFNIEQYERADINILDASSLLVNMLDNAIEAVKVSEGLRQKSESETTQDTKKKVRGVRPSLLQENHVYVASEEREGKIYLEVGNVKDSRQKVVEIRGRYATTKENKDGHGYGMEIIRGIAEKYNGKMEVRYGKDFFVNRVCIPDCVAKGL